MTVLASREASLLDYQDVGVLLILRRKGLRIVETPVAMQPRAGCFAGIPLLVGCGKIHAANQPALPCPGRLQPFATRVDD